MNENEWDNDLENCTDVWLDDEEYDWSHEYNEQILAENEMIDMLLADRRLLDKALPYLPPDIEMDFAVALDNAFIDSLVKRIEARTGKKLSDIERTKLESFVLYQLIKGYDEE